MSNIEIRTLYDGEAELLLPTALLEQFQVEKSEIRDSAAMVSSYQSGLAHGAGPLFAAILISIQAITWEYAIGKVLDGLGKLIKDNWFSKASKNKKIPSTKLAKLVQKNSDHFPYSLLNISVFESSLERRWIQVLFPYPMTDKQAEKAVAKLRKLLEKIESDSYGLLIYDKGKGKWIIQGAIKLRD